MSRRRALFCEVRAIDYLLKSFDRERFDAALDRARQSIATGRQQEIGETLRDLLRERGDYKVVLNDGTELKLSQNYRASLSSLLGQRGVQ